MKASFAGCCALLSLIPAVLAAQGIPFVAVEATAGRGWGTTHTGIADYSAHDGSLVRFAGAIRLGGPGRLRPVLTLENSPTIHHFIASNPK